MNAGHDYTRAKAQARANADLRGEPWQMWYYNGAWWIDRLASTTRPIDGGEIIQPSKGLDNGTQASK